MIEGLENDDQYIMVEDEFLTTAQAFTNFLHHAEYVRRKKQAKIENATKVTDVTQSRPTDGRTPVSSELRNNIQAERASNRRNEALDQMREDASRPLVDSELEDEEIEGSDEDREDDPWMGTSLQPLMAASRQPRSLVGLQGVKSTTRAAMGYSNATSSQTGLQIQATQETAGDDRREVDNRRASDNTAMEARGSAVDDDTASTDDDDLDAISRPRRNPPLPQPRSSIPTPNIFSSGSAAIPRASAKISTKTSPVDGKRMSLNSIPLHRDSSSNIFRHRSESRQPFKSRFSTFFDDWDEPSLPNPSPPPPLIKQEEKEERKPSRIEAPAGSKRTKREGSDDKSRKQRLSEVPTFL